MTGVLLKIVAFFIWIYCISLTTGVISKYIAKNKTY